MITRLETLSVGKTVQLEFINWITVPHKTFLKMFEIIDNE